MSGLREIVYRRAEGRSDLSGAPLVDGWECHHRRPGGMGGSIGAPLQQSPANALALQPWEHNMHPRSVHMAPRWAKVSGYLLPRGQGRLSVPTLVPVWWRGQAWVWLLDDGTLVRASLGDLARTPLPDEED